MDKESQKKLAANRDLPKLSPAQENMVILHSKTRLPRALLAFENQPFALTGKSRERAIAEVKEILEREKAGEISPPETPPSVEDMFSDPKIADMLSQAAALFLTSLVSPRLKLGDIYTEGGGIRVRERRGFLSAYKRLRRHAFRLRRLRIERAVCKLKALRLKALAESDGLQPRSYPLRLHRWIEILPKRWRDRRYVAGLFYNLFAKPARQADPPLKKLPRGAAKPFSSRPAKAAPRKRQRAANQKQSLKAKRRKRPE